MASVIVIGGGVAGLTSAIYLKKQGFDVTVYEKSHVVGGNLTGWKKDGFLIDNCIHWLTGTNPVTKQYKIWKETGILDGAVTYQQDSLYVSELDGREVPLSVNPDFTLKKMLDVSPEDKKEIVRFIRAVKSLRKAMGISGKNHDNPATFLIRAAAMPYIIKYHSMTLDELADRFRHPLLKDFFTDFIGAPFSALALIMVFANFAGENGGLIEGGSFKAASGIKKRLLDLGGKIETNKTAVKAEISDGKVSSVEFEDGEIASADYYVFATDLDTSFNKLLRRPKPRGVVRCEKDSLALRFSAFHAAIGVDANALPFKGTRVIPVSDKLGKILGSDRLKLREFSHEKYFSPDGRNLIQTLSFLSEDEAKKFIELYKADKEKYNELKTQICSAQIKAIESFYPELSGKLYLVDSWSPATYNRFLGSKNGEFMAYSLPPLKLPKIAGSKIAGVKNASLASQWQMLPGGLPCASRAGKKAAEFIIKKHALSENFIFARIIKRVLYRAQKS